MASRITLISLSRNFNFAADDAVAAEIFGSSIFAIQSARNPIPDGRSASVINTDTFKLTWSFNYFICFKLEGATFVSTVINWQNVPCPCGHKMEQAHAYYNQLQQSLLNKEYWTSEEG